MSDKCQSCDFAATKGFCKRLDDGWYMSVFCDFHYEMMLVESSCFVKNPSLKVLMTEVREE